MSEVLLIEDDPTLQRLIENFLHSKKYVVSCADDGRQGLELYKGQPFDVVVTDVRLPKMSGLEVLKEISTHSPKHPPVVIITGHGDKQMAIRALRYGAFDFLEKPFSPVALETILTKALIDCKADIAEYRLQFSQHRSEGLTERESEVAALAADGLRNEEIAARLSMGTETVKTHLKNTFRKLGINNRMALNSYFKKAA